MLLFAFLICAYNKLQFHALIWHYITDRDCLIVTCFVDLQFYSFDQMRHAVIVLLWRMLVHLPCTLVLSCLVSSKKKE